MTTPTLSAIEIRDAARKGASSAVRNLGFDAERRELDSMAIEFACDEIDYLLGDADLAELERGVATALDAALENAATHYLFG